MTHPTVSDEMVEKAAKAMRPERWSGEPGYRHGEYARNEVRHEARAALEAVAGDIAKQVGEEIAQAIEAYVDDRARTQAGEYQDGWLDAGDELARIAREIGAGDGD